MSAYADFEKVLLPNIEKDETEWIDAYGHYEAAQKALEMEPDAIIGVIKDSGLRGRGGAGFPTGMKWSFLPKGVFPRYLAVNADESEPGTCKDRPLMEQRPHLLVEGIICALRAIQGEEAWIYIRGEYYKAAKVLNKAVQEAYDKGYLGDNAFGKGVRCHITVHRGAGAYICGEETALLTSLEGYRGYPKLKPPFPAVTGFYAKPTIINNVETIIDTGIILKRGAEWFKGMVHERTTGMRLYSVSGHVKKPGVYELPPTVTLKQLIYDVCGGIRGDRKLKFVIPGGSSVPWLKPDQIDIPLSHEGVAAAGSMLGSSAVMVMDETVPAPWALANLSHFYRHESCGQCTPCREGSAWMHKILQRICAGQGTMDDLETLKSIAGEGKPGSGMISGKSICALGDAAAWPVGSALIQFWDEFVDAVKKGAPIAPPRFWMADGEFVYDEAPVMAGAH
ncbi:MAG: NADH-quinone oxidoreductase subunit NuoF [Sumerlaeia bacterium]